MERFAPPRPDHSPPESLSDEELARAIDSLGRKLGSVRVSLRAARLAGLAALALIMATGFTLLWVGPQPFLPRIFENGAAVTVPELLAWWGMVIAAALFLGIVSYRLFAHRMRVVRGWTHKAHDLERRLGHAEAEARRRRTA
jgi:sterol desaturase/sphingolipid hydroxylase (fatty acid hydroxylase superfamily)